MMDANCRTGCIGQVALRYIHQAASVSRHPAQDSWVAAREDTPGSESAKRSRASASRRLGACLARPLAVSDHPNRAAMYANSAEPSHQQAEAHPLHNPNVVRPSLDSVRPDRSLAASCRLVVTA